MVRRRFAGLVVVCLFLIAPAELLAATDEGDSASADSSKNVSITLSTLNLAQPILGAGVPGVTYSPAIEVLAEGNVANKLGIGGSVNYFNVRAELASDTVSFNFLTFALQQIWYPVGNFENGMQLGLQESYQRGFGKGSIDNVDVQAGANTFSVAGLIGYKVIDDSGFTFLGQLGGGARWSFARADAQSGSQEATATDRNVFPKIVFNINVGWSF